MIYGNLIFFVTISTTHAHDVGLFRWFLLNSLLFHCILVNLLDCFEAPANGRIKLEDLEMTQKALIEGRKDLKAIGS